MTAKLSEAQHGLSRSQRCRLRKKGVAVPFITVAPERERFASRYIVDPSGCWLWTGQIQTTGYGGFYLEKKRAVLAHRYSYLIHRGSPDGFQVCHTCDVRRCVNPDHLFLGTIADNQEDKRLKGRSAIKLTPEIVRKIRADTRTHALVARDFNISDVTVSSIKLRRTWRHI